MSIKTHKYILSSCPKCGEIASFKLDYLDIKAKLQKNMVCQCGESFLFLDGFEDRVYLSIACRHCEKDHIYNMDIDNFFGESRRLYCQEGDVIAVLLNRSMEELMKEKLQYAKLS